MAPKAKITKDEIINEAFNILALEGEEKLNARYIAKKLCISTQPIFYYFTNMDDLMGEVRKKVNDLYDQYIQEGLKNQLPFLGSGLAYIKFAKEKPNYFKFLFMQKANQDYTDIHLETDKGKQLIAETISKSTGLSLKQSELFHLMSWIFVHGIATMIASNTIKYDDDMIEYLLKTNYKATLEQFKKGK